MIMTNKDEIKNQAISDDELKEVAGGGCWFGAKDVAPDGHDIGCRFTSTWYDSWDEYNYKHDICKYCGGKLGKEDVFSYGRYKVCTECGHDNEKENKW